MFIFKILILAIILASSFGCNSAENLSLVKDELKTLKTEEPKNQENIEKNVDKIPNDLIIEFSDQCPGFEFCLTYSLTINADGNILFGDKRNRKPGRKLKGKISKEQVEEIAGEIEKTKFFDLDEKYNGENCPLYMTDSHTISINIQADSKRKKVHHYLGCGYGVNDFKNPLFKLTELENKIREIAGVKRWIGGRE